MLEKEKKTSDIPCNHWYNAISRGRYSWQQHALIRIAERNILQRSVLDIIAACDIIKEYPDDKPFPSALFTGEDDEGQSLHVVASIEIEQDWVYIITAYNPGLLHFEEDYRKRRKS